MLGPVGQRGELSCLHVRGACVSTLWARRCGKFCRSRRQALYFQVSKPQRLMWLGAKFSRLTFSASYFQTFPPFNWMKTWLEVQFRRSLSGQTWIRESFNFFAPQFPCWPNGASSCSQETGNNPRYELHCKSVERRKQTWFSYDFALTTVGSQ